MKKILAALIIIISVSGAVWYIVSASASNTDKKTQNQINTQEYWPEGGWRTSTPEEQGMDSGKLAEMINSIEKSGKSVDSITIIRNGYLVSEAYFYPYQKGLMHFMNSCTKSFTSAFVGMSLDDGHIKSIDDKVLGYFPNQNIAKVDRLKQNLKIRNLLTMTTGLDWDFKTNASTNEMLQSRNWTNFILDQPMKEEPGRHFLYCNGATHLLSAIVQKTTGKSLAELAKDKFTPMGIKDIYWNTSPENVSNGYTGLYLLPDDAAKFGYLYLKKGNWNGKQLISEKWIEESTKKQVKADWTPLFPGYGYMWWTCSFGGYAALGQGGDYIFVVPGLDLVAVFTGGLYNLNDIFYPGELMKKYIVPSVRSNAPLQADPATSESLKEAVDMVQKAPSPEFTSSLPGIAGKISGKPFVMNDSTTLTLRFTDNNECVIEQDSNTMFKISLDNVYHISDAGNLPGLLINSIHTAARGRWLDKETLEVTVQDLEDGVEETYTAHIENDRIDVRITSNLYPEATNSGRLKE